MGICTIQLTSRFAGGVHPPPPPPGNSAAAQGAFQTWLAWTNQHGINDLAAKCAQNRSAQVALQREKSTAAKPTWGNASCFAVVEVVKRQGNGFIVADAPGWSQSDDSPEGKVHAERSAIAHAYNLLGEGIEAITRIYVELSPCGTRGIRQADSCIVWLATMAPNATVMYSHEHPDQVDAWKKLNAAMANERPIYEFAPNFLNAGEVKTSSDGLYVRWQGKEPRAGYHVPAKNLMILLEGAQHPVVPMDAGARVDGT
ncbi:hypothetical protein DP939_22925 [Spongiactinospora rosea]|uniref:Uncharacterized protein n=1 Tax=Spongiactinospora rosea TaxID=2248750 RepID=A0A366LUU3_9ACTN|nr:hypothetical protein [Spongiactinospora rosea]RBQ17728.1 hypothetical protein DP939_22925 [Spongiactinospora rosea]